MKFILILVGCMFVIGLIKRDANLFGTYLDDGIITFYCPNTDRQTIKQQENEVSQIAFLKVHKTGSGTMKQIFLRFGHQRNLTFVLPNLRETRTRGVISEVDTLTNKNILPPPPLKSYDVLCCHVIYNRKAFKETLPLDTIYVGIVREPISRLQSAINFYEPRYVLEHEGQTPLSTYSANPLKYEPRDPRLSMTNNRMAVDFGFPIRLFPGYLHNDFRSEIYKYIKQLDEDFELIIMNEKFEESLVLMKRILHWQIKDILFVKKHVGNKISKRKRLQETDIANMKQFLYLDIALYEFAAQKLNKQIKKEGNSFQDEVDYFKHVKEIVQEYCDNNVHEEPLMVKSSCWSDGFQVSEMDCALLKTNNLNDKERIRTYGTLN